MRQAKNETKACKPKRRVQKKVATEVMKCRNPRTASHPQAADSVAAKAVNTTHEMPLQEDCRLLKSLFFAMLALAEPRSRNLFNSFQVFRLPKKVRQVMVLPQMVLNSGSGYLWPEHRTIPNLCFDTLRLLKPDCR